MDGIYIVYQNANGIHWMVNAVNNLQKGKKKQQQQKQKNMMTLQTLCAFFEIDLMIVFGHVSNMRWALKQLDN